MAQPNSININITQTFIINRLEDYEMMLHESIETDLCTAKKEFHDVCTGKTIPQDWLHDYFNGRPLIVSNLALTEESCKHFLDQAPTIYEHVTGKVTPKGKSEWSESDIMELNRILILNEQEVINYQLHFIFIH